MCKTLYYQKAELYSNAERVSEGLVLETATMSFPTSILRDILS
ncbi:22344_t:CDS:2 [Entrophospora sp. SA101]|nr:22344_t:CDS:2 [Entrophospora sp. SA101]